LLIQNWQYEGDKTIITVEVSWSILSIKIKDIYFASVEDFCALQECDQCVHRIFDLLPTHALLI
jgi:hypothetical protein